MKIIYYIITLGLLSIAQFLGAEELKPIFDVHTHYKWDQEEVTSPSEALQILDRAGVKKAVVIGRPADFALKLYELAPDRIIPFFGPYKSSNDKLAWQFRIGLLREAKKGLETGLYKGIGELHLIGGMAIPWQKNKVFIGLMSLAREYDVPLMVHCEYSSIKPMLSICQKNPDNRFLMAHAGAVMTPKKVATVLESCPNVVMDLAARDPWRYVNNPIADKSGQLLPEWRSVIVRYADGFMIGSDPVWPVDKGASWDEPDSGWTQVEKFINFHRQWLAQLPDDVEEKIRWSNAEQWFKQ
jgi:hypothetical protein